MKPIQPENTSQDYDRKHKQDYISKNPRAIKGVLDKKDDKRELAREEHTNHFTNRAPNQDAK